MVTAAATIWINDAHPAYTRAAASRSLGDRDPGGRLPQLAAWGDRRDGEARSRVTKPERDLERLLEDLADDFPLLRPLVDRRRAERGGCRCPGGGQERVPGPLLG